LRKKLDKEFVILHYTTKENIARNPDNMMPSRLKPLLQVHQNRQFFKVAFSRE